MSLERYVNSLPKRKQFEIAIKLDRLAMYTWENFVATTDNKRDNWVYYYDGAVGGEHLIDQTLLQRTVDEVEKYVNSDFNPANYDETKFAQLKDEWWTPIRGLEWEEDWFVPDELKLLVFSISNLLNAATGMKETVFKESTIYVSINQSIDALTSSKKMTIDEAHYAIGLLTPGL